MAIYITLDAGGTKCNGILFDSDMNILGRGLSGGVNLSQTSPEDSRANMVDCIEQMFKTYRPERVDKIFLSFVGPVDVLYEELEKRTQLGERTYLYTGFCWGDDPTRHGPMVTVLDRDMLTVIEGPNIIMPSGCYSSGSGYEGHEFFEASSIRKFGDTYYFVYSSVVMHELCYATSKYPDRGFKFGGVIVSNNDIGISTYKPAEKPMFYGANNHGGLVKVGDDYYIFYHRHTDGTNYSRQGMAERVTLLPDGSIPQVEMTSCGLNGGPLEGRGTYPAYIACNLFTSEDNMYTGGSGKNGFWLDGRFPRITQDGRDGDHEPGYIMNMADTATCGFKYFDCRGISRITLRVRGYAGGCFIVKTAWDGPELGRVPLRFTNIWTDFSADVAIPDGVNAIYLTYSGGGNASLLSFTLE